MAQPVYRLSVSNRDKSERTYTDYKGQKKTSRYESVGAVFSNGDGRLSIALDKKITIDPEKMWLNLYKVEPRDEDEDEAPKSKKTQKTAAKKTKKAPPPPEDDEESEDGEDPFAD